MSSSLQFVQEILMAHLESDSTYVNPIFLLHYYIYRQRLYLKKNVLFSLQTHNAVHTNEQWQPAVMHNLRIQYKICKLRLKNLTLVCLIKWVRLTFIHMHNVST